MRRRLTGSELRLAEASERAHGEAPEATMRRRDFLSRSAYAAGLAAAVASLPLNLLLGEAAKREALRRRPALAAATCRSTTSSS